MNKSYVIGILRESRKEEFRAPLTPKDVRWFKKRGIDVEVESSAKRIFSDKEYRQAGAKIVKRFSKAAVLIGIKEPNIKQLYPNKIYMIFSHTAKGQKHNRGLLKGIIKKGITLIDYEKIQDVRGRRLVYFGRFAGICGMIDSLSFFGKKVKLEGMPTPLLSIKPSDQYKSFAEVKSQIAKVSATIKRKGLNKDISPLIVGITGGGSVQRGVNEVLDVLGAIKINLSDLKKIVGKNRKPTKKVYRVVLDFEEMLRPKNGKKFSLKKYLANPKQFESNMDAYLPYLDILMHTNYWDKKYPRLITKKLVHALWKKSRRLKFIGDVSCDLKGSVELTYRATTTKDPVYTYYPNKKKYLNGCRVNGITILAQDNLPTKLPKDSSSEFSSLIREYVCQVASCGVLDIAEHVAIPREIRDAVISQGNKLTKPYKYLQKFLSY